MARGYWFTEWHGEKLSTSGTDAGVSGSPGGSTSMSTGVQLALSTKASLGHTHPQSDITNLTSTLAALSLQISTKAAGSHTHATSDVTGLDSTLAGLASQISTKAAGTHTHAIGDVTNLSSTLSGLASQISTKAAGTHTHVTADVTGLDTALSSKASLASGVVPTAQLGSGSASGTTFLRGDQTWATPTAAASGVIPSTWVVASTHTLTGSTTMQSASGLSFSVSSASVYRFDFLVAWQTISSATGIAFGVNGPASPSPLVYGVWMSTGFGQLIGRAGRGFGVQTIASPGSSAANLNEFGHVYGLVRTTTDAGTLQLQFATEVAGSTVSVRGGSVGFLYGPL